MKAAEVHGARAEFCCRSSAVGAMKAAEVHGAKAECSGRSGTGGTAAAVAATGAAVKAATGAAVKAATRAAAKVTAAAVCCGGVRGATEVAVVNGTAERCRGHGGGGHRGGSGSGHRGGSECTRQRCAAASYGLAQGLQRATGTRGLAAGPERFEGRSRYNSLSPRGRPSGVPNRR